MRLYYEPSENYPQKKIQPPHHSCGVVCRTNYGSCWVDWMALVPQRAEIGE